MNENMNKSIDIKEAEKKKKTVRINNIDLCPSLLTGL